MAFKVTARTLLHLGADLISSDSIALFELVKNSFDARSPNGVTIDVKVILPGWPIKFTSLLKSAMEAEELREFAQPNDVQAAESLLEEATEALRQALIGDHDPSAPGSPEWIGKIKTASSFSRLQEILAEANTITVTDTGSGMSLDDLTNIYLTIGTRTRLKEKQEWTPQNERDAAPIILGEKGLGRLSVMRLGDEVSVRTTKKGESCWNNLDIDWRLFSHDNDALLESISIEPTIGDKKVDPAKSGTEIRIALLKSQWSFHDVEVFANEEVSKLNDPFESSGKYLVKLFFNSKRISVPTLEKNLAKYAHAYVSARLSIDKIEKEPKIQVVGKVEYRLRNKETIFDIEAPELMGMTGLSPNQLADLGPISMEAYWFNRQLLQSISENGIKIRDLVSKWSGGLMLYRDGFRVFPYGTPGDDWLKLDAKALASSGYKVNRKQIVGRVNITSRDNPQLRDQTNREGLVDCPETDAFKAILKHILEIRFRQFLNKTDSELQESQIELNFSDLSERVQKEQDNLQHSFDLLKTRYPAILQEKETIDRIQDSIKQLEKMMADAETLAENFEAGRSQMIHLAALGLTVEMLAHELNRTTRYALGSLEEAKAAAGTNLLPNFAAIEFQLQTIQKRLSVLDPESVSRRQTKVSCNIADLATSIIATHESTFDRLKIPTKNIVKIKPSGSKLVVKMVKGMLTQVLDNLIDNSLFWLKQGLRLDPHLSPKIEIEIDSEKRLIYFSDNGPGIPEKLGEKIFEAFFTSKPPGQGKGLGLYIASELMKYHDAEIGLSDYKQIHPGRLNTFVITLPPN